MMTQKVLTIGITSYNRVDELLRCLESIDISEHVDDVEIVVSEDKSPRREEIRQVVKEFSRQSGYDVVLNENENNLGYDRNLKKLIDLSKGRYILLMSDDDVFAPGRLDSVVEVLSNNEISLYYTSVYNPNIERYARIYEKTCMIEENQEEYIKAHIYDSILFSGLTFNADLVKNIDGERFLNKNYIQVYMFIYAGSRGDVYYERDNIIIVGGDGINGYGRSESSDKNELLANRGHPLSQLEFHKGLIDVIKMYDGDFDTNYFSSFEKEYSKRSIVGMMNAARYGNNVLWEYWKKMNSLGLCLRTRSRAYFIILRILGYDRVKALTEFYKKTARINGLEYVKQ